MSRGSYYKRMDANRRVQFLAWKDITNRRIEKLNTISAECYTLAYRGRNHRLVLLDSTLHAIASGMVNINQVLDLLEQRYQKALSKDFEIAMDEYYEEESKDEKTSDSNK